MDNRNKNVVFSIGNAQFWVAFVSPLTGADAGSPTGPMHTHSFFEIHVLSQGKISLFSDREYELFGDEILIVAPGTYHNTERYDEGTERLCLSMEIRRSDAKGESGDAYAYFQEAFQSEKIVQLHSCAKLVKKLKEITEFIFDPAPMAKYRLRELFALWTIELAEKIHEEKRLAKKDDLQNEGVADRESALFLRLDNLLSDPTITLQQLSNDLFLSKKQLTALIKKRYDKPFKQAIIAVRIENVKKELLSTDKTVKEVALSYGYTNLTNFYKTFKKLVGCLPNEYRKKRQTKGERP